MTELNNVNIEFYNGLTEELDKLGITNGIFVDSKFSHTERLNGITIPPFVDSHTHILNHMVRKNWFDLSAIKSKNELLAFLKDAVDNNAQYIIGYGFDESYWPEKSMPTGAELDDVSKEKPILIIRIDGHIAITNTYLSKLINKKTNVLLEDEIYQAIIILAEKLGLNFDFGAIEDYLRLGILATADMGSYILPNGVLNRLSNKIITKLYVMIQTLKQYNITYENLLDRYNLYLGGIKIISDGSIGARTAYLFEPYKDDPNNRGELLVNDELMSEIINIAIRFRLKLAVHAIGDAAIDFVLKYLKKMPSELKARIEHFEMPHEDHIDLLTKHEIVPSMQPNFIANWQYKGGLYDRRLGWERAKNMNPLKSVLRQRQFLVFGSDNMPLNPLYGIFGALTHPLAHERLNLSEALKCYTLFSAESLGITNYGLNENKEASFVVIHTKTRKPKPKDLLKSTLTVYSKGKLISTRPIKSF